jgi:hypothetical protein
MYLADNQHAAHVLGLSHHYDGPGRCQHLQRDDVSGTQFLAQTETNLFALPH